MYKKLAELKVDTSSDYYDKVTKALEKAGFILVFDSETLSSKYYIVVGKENEEHNENRF